MFKHLNTRIPKRIEQEKDKVSAVLIPLIKKNDGYHILFEVRSNKLSQTAWGKSVSRAAGENVMKHPWRLRSVKLVKNY